MRTPKLVKIDLKKCTVNKESGLGHDHPDINSRSLYLACIGGDFCAGHFSKQWYGWNFDDWGTSGISLDKPGTNGSMWKGLWRIVK